MHDVLKNLSSSPTFDDLKLDANTFRQILAENIVFVTKAFKNRLVIPDFEVFCKNITRLVKIYISMSKNFYSKKNDGTLWDRWNTFLRIIAELMIANYRVKTFVRQSQFSKQTLLIGSYSVFMISKK